MIRLASQACKNLHQNQADDNQAQSLYLREWNPIFATRNRTRNSRHYSFLQFLKELAVERDVLEAFLQDAESSVPSQQFEVQRARNFLRQTLSEESIHHRPIRAWVESRKKSTEHCKVRAEWFTYDKFSEYLTETSVCEKSDLDFSRRLIYVPSFNERFLSAIVTTASRNEALALRTMLYRHVAREPRIEVIIPVRDLVQALRAQAFDVVVQVDGYLMFNLLFNVSYLKLRETPSKQSQLQPPRTKIQQFETDLSFLNIDCKDGKGPALFAIRTAHTTISIFGCDHFEWTGYAFSDHNPNDTEYWDIDCETEDNERTGNDDVEDDGSEYEEVVCDMLNDDRFASDGLILHPDANPTIWDPRRYFLRVVAIRVEIILQEYVYMVETLESGIEHWKKHIIFTTSKTHQEKDQSTHDQQSLENTVVLKELLQELRAHLSITAAAWDDFSAPDGHINFFSDITDRDAKIALHTLRELFGKLKRLERKLAILDRHCVESADVLTQRMVIENNELSLQNHRLSNQAHNLNLLTSKLSEQTVRIALESQSIAKETSRTTRVNAQLLFISTPFAFVLQYFCSERNFFSIDRTPKAFVLCLFVMLLAFPTINFGVEWLNQHRKHLQRKLLVRLGRNQPIEAANVIEQILDSDRPRNA